MTPGWSGDGWAASGGSGITPTAPSITHSRTVSANTSDWNVANNGSSSSNNHNLFGTSGYGSATITVYRDGVLQGTALTASDGTWSYATGVMPDATMAFTATITVGGIASALSPAFNITVTPEISGWNNIPDGTFTMNGKTMAVFTNGNSWVFQNPDTHTLRFETRQGDQWVQDSGSLERSETSEYFVTPNNVLQRVTFEIMWETGAANGASNWFIDLQLHADDMQVGQATSPFVSMGLCGSTNTQTAGDRFYIQSRDWNSSYGSNIQATSHIHDLYIAPGNIVRGVWHRVQIESLANQTSGHLYVWFDGTQIVNYGPTQPHGFGYPAFMEWGIYRGFSTADTQAIRYRNYINASAGTPV